ncbi:MAG: hypothetical protein JXR83_00395 [Deltaproteobacteria bacterium]|nr:hypothetical protein [Deltaproteobacteria bacterium]
MVGDYHIMLLSAGVALAVGCPIAVTDHDAATAADGGVADANTPLPFELPEHCGQKSPKKILALGAGDEALVQPHPDGYLVTVTSATAEHSLHFADRCGDNSFLVAASLGVPLVTPGGQVLARSCIDDDHGALHLVDLQGPATWQVVDGIRCYPMIATAAGVVLTRATPQAFVYDLLLLRAPLAAAQVPEVLTSLAYTWNLDVIPGCSKILAITGDFELVAIDLATAIVTTLAADAIRFSISPDGTALAWQHLDGSIYLHPLGTDQHTKITEAFTPLNPPYEILVWTPDSRYVYLFDDLSFICSTLACGVWEAASATFYEAPDHVGAGGRTLSSDSALPDGSIWLRALPSSDVDHYHWFPATDAQVPLFPASLSRSYDDSFYAILPHAIAGVFRDSTMDRSGDLWIAPLDESSAAYQVGSAVGIYLYPISDRALFAIAPDERRSLEAIEMESGARFDIAEKVDVYPGPLVDGDAVVYVTTDIDPAVWVIGRP